MSLFPIATRRAFVAASLLSLTALAAPMAFAGCDGGITVQDAYARVSSKLAKAGAIFMVVENHGCTDDRITGAKTDVAMKTALHTHKIGADGIAHMMAIEGGVPLPAGGEAVFARGHDHVMLMGLKHPLVDGDTIKLTLMFEKAAPVTVTVPVDNER